VTAPPIRFGLSRLARADLGEYLDWAAYADGAGYDLIGFGDSQTLWADTHVMLALTAQRTRRVRLGPMVSNPITRHPTVAANAMSTLQKVSGGRAFFGIGPGDSSIYNIGAKPLPRAAYEEYVLAVKGLCAGERVSYRGETLQMHWEVAPVPLWLAGDGPRMLRLAGRIADGVIVGNGATPELVEFALGHIRAGAESAGRDPARIEIWWMIRVLVAPSEAEGIEALRFYLASYTNVRYRYAMTNKGIAVPPDIQEKIRGLRSEYRGSEHVKPETTFNASLIDKYGLRDWIARQFAITGPAAHCIRRLRDLVDAGATNFVMPQLLPNTLETTQEIAEKILPAFR
jgi:5,10-methylenetetrahydromethanopterin reductase